MELRSWSMAALDVLFGAAIELFLATGAGVVLKTVRGAIELFCVEETPQITPAMMMIARTMTRAVPVFAVLDIDSNYLVGN